MLPLLLAVPSYIYSFFHGVIPTSSFLMIFILVSYRQSSQESTVTEDNPSYGVNGAQKMCGETSSNKYDDIPYYTNVQHSSTAPPEPVYGNI